MNTTTTKTLVDTNITLCRSRATVQDISMKHNFVIKFTSTKKFDDCTAIWECINVSTNLQTKYQNIYSIPKNLMSVVEVSEKTTIGWLFNSTTYHYVVRITYPTICENIITIFWKPEELMNLSNIEIETF